MTQAPKPLSASCILPSAHDNSLLRQAAAACRDKLGTRPDLVFAFVSPDYREHLADLIETLQIDGHASRIVGASASGLTGVGQELEGTSGVSLLFLSLPDTTVKRSATPLATAECSGSIVLSHPPNDGLDDNLDRWNRIHSEKTPLIGGCVTGGPNLDDLFLFDETGLINDDQIFLTFAGGLRINPIVAPGCRPIGEPLVVTAASGTEILSLGNREAYEVLCESFASLGDALQLEAEGHIFAGVVRKEELDQFRPRDFNVQQIIGAALEDGRLRLEQPVRSGQTLQFQWREALTAEMQLRDECDAQRQENGVPFAALLFAGKGRGRALFGVDDRNVKTVEESLGRFPLAGLHAFGEIGPAHGEARLHHHSVCGALFYPGVRDPSD